MTDRQWHMMTALEHMQAAQLYAMQINEYRNISKEPYYWLAQLHLQAAMIQLERER